MSPNPRPAPRRFHSAPLHAQLAALCWREVDGQREVLLVTSSTGRWILPKGWPIGGKRDSATAKIEAWEEAGVRRGKVDRRPLGSFIAIKRTLEGDDEPCELQVFAIEVHKTADDYPEKDMRDRVWVSPEVAATMVDEDGLRDIFAKFARSAPRTAPRTAKSEAVAKGRQDRDKVA
jgi:8-oxo-dGTP pyrophosphatase MutT (NUDIX family)